jgi:hypothetical protein
MNDNDKSRHWHFRRRLGRLQVGIHIYKHVYYPSVTDRWVIQPSLIYDRKGVSDV